MGVYGGSDFLCGIDANFFFVFGFLRKFCAVHEGFYALMIC